MAFDLVDLALQTKEHVKEHEIDTAFMVVMVWGDDGMVYPQLAYPHTLHPKSLVMFCEAAVRQAQAIERDADPDIDADEYVSAPPKSFN